MKLYFYIYDSFFNKLKYGECEVIEKPKTYYPADKFPAGFYGAYVSKTDIGRTSGYSNNTVILTERNDTLAKSLLKEAIQKEIDDFQKKIEKRQKEIDFIDIWESEENHD